MPRKPVHNKRCERFAFDILGNDQQRAAHLGHLFEDRQKILHRADLLFADQDQAILKHALHPIRIGHEIRRKIAAIELHAFDDIQRGLDGLGLFNRDDAILADFLHRLGDNVADGGVVIGRNRSDLSDHFTAYRLRKFLDLFDSHFDGPFDAALHGHRVCAGGDCLHALAEDGLCQHGRRRGAVTRHIAGLRCDFLHHLGAHVLHGILQFDFFRDRDAVFRNQRRAEFLVENHIAALGTQA